MELGKLEKIVLREVWQTEAGDFTPWLAREENLKVLGDAIGIELELEAQEKDVGPFRADILCKDTVNDHWVLIENQLEKTDHTHLGQLLTYAAGLKATTIVWISQRFTDEHRAALDWLNNITSEDINFFGLEVELWRIGESQIAPKFNIISMPNDWSKSVKATELSAIQLLQLEFWRGLKGYLIESESFIKSQKPSAQNWASFPIGRTDFRLHALMNTREKRLTCDLGIMSNHATDYFNILIQDKESIESEMGFSLEWREMPDRKESHIALHITDIDALAKEKWIDYFYWIKTTLENLHKAFSSRVKNLNLDDIK